MKRKQSGKRNRRGSNSGQGKSRKRNTRSQRGRAAQQEEGGPQPIETVEQ